MNKLRGEHEIKLDADEMALIFQDNKLDDLASLIAQERESLENILTKHKGIQFQGNDGFDVEKALEDLVPETKLGDIWQLGDHRIVCADCTDERSVKKLLPDMHVDIILTDPPYSSGGWQEAGKSQSSIGTTAKPDRLERDGLSTRGYQSLLREAIRLVNSQILYIFTDWRMWTNTFDVAERCGYPVRNMIVWDKKYLGMGFPWRTQHELILYSNKKAGVNEPHLNQGNVIQADRTGNINHSTEKPVELLGRIIRNIGDTKTVYDPFLGSGSTMIACEQTNRICYGVEIDPHYVDVCCKRYEAYTGKKAVKLT